MPPDRRFRLETGKRRFVRGRQFEQIAELRRALMSGSEAPSPASPKGESAAPVNAPAAKGTEATPSGAPKAAIPQRTEEKGGSSGVSTQSKPDPKTADDLKPDSKAKSPDSTKATPDSKDTRNPTAESAPPAAGNKATGNAATSGTAAPPPEKQAQISSSIKQEKVEEVTNVNFNISVGTAVPSSVRYYPLPPRIVEIYPEWRGYDFIRVRSKYIILRPKTREIVYIIEG